MFWRCLKISYTCMLSQIQTGACGVSTIQEKPIMHHPVSKLLETNSSQVSILAKHAIHG